MIQNAVAHFVCQIQPCAAVFELFNDAQALHIVFKSARNQSVQHVLAGMAKRRMSEIMSQCNGLRQILVEAESTRDRPRDLRDLKRMCQTRSVMVALRREEYLRFMLHSAERLAMQDAVSIANEHRSQRTRFDRYLPPL